MLQSAQLMSTTTETLHRKTFELCSAIGKVIRGKHQVIESAVVALLAEGHLLIEDVPGVGKTTLGHALASAVSSTFHRIQFTSDLLPSDVLGVAIYNPNTQEFDFKRGPVFANIVLADEINRTTPKTQSALLEAMNESQVTIDNVTYALPRPFMVLATQNPVGHHGTYPLPESQLDRFLMKIDIGYPDPAAEREILQRHTNGNHARTVEAVLGPDEVLELQLESRKVHIGDPLIEYMIEIVNLTRNHPEIELGVSPRGTTALFRAAQTLALVRGRDYVLPDDIKRLIGPVFAHRLVVTRSGAHRQQTPSALLDEIVHRVAVPA